MKYNHTKIEQNDFEKSEIQDILKFSKIENKKYLYQILSIKNITAFDAGYIMNRLDLDDNKIKILNFALIKYEKDKTINQSESYNDFLFRIVRNLEKLEKRNAKLLKEIAKCKDNIENFKMFVDFLVAKSAFLIGNSVENQNQTKFVFSKVYIDD